MNFCPSRTSACCADAGPKKERGCCESETRNLHRFFGLSCFGLCPPCFTAYSMPFCSIYHAAQTCATLLDLSRPTQTLASPDRPLRATAITTHTHTPPPTTHPLRRDYTSWQTIIPKRSKKHATTKTNFAPSLDHRRSSDRSSSATQNAGRSGRRSGGECACACAFLFRRGIFISQLFFPP